MTDTLNSSQYSATSEHSLIKGSPKAMREWLMSCPPDSRVSPSHKPDNEKAAATVETCGPKRSPYFAQYDHDTHSWRTSQVCLVTNTLDVFSETWPKAGLMLDGVCYPQPNAERRISEIGSGLWSTPSAVDHRDMSRNAVCVARENNQQVRLAGEVKMWPTPNVPNGGRSVKHAEQIGGTFYHNGKKVQLGLESAVRLWPTPAARDWKDGDHKAERERKTPPLAVHAGGALNPDWVEWLMNFPIAWTSLEPLSDSEALPWETEPDIPRVATGVKHRVQRLKALGNAQCPIVAATAWRLLS